MQHEASAHIDTFARDNLPAPREWPEIILSRPELQYPPRINAGKVLLDDAIAEGHGDRPAIFQEDARCTYIDLRELSDRIAHVLVREEGLVPGNRVLLMAPNSIFLAAAWLAVMRAGAVAVTVMPLLRASELGQIAVKARVDHVLCDARVLPEVTQAAHQTGLLSSIRTWGGGDLERSMALYGSPFEVVDTAAEDVALLAFTSGTTGSPKATMHFQRDILVMADIVGRHLLETGPADVHVGSPPLGFTFGLGALLVFPLRFRASVAYVERPTVENLLGAIQKFRATTLFTAPTLYRSLIEQLPRYDVRSLRQCVSAGEPLPKSTSDAWAQATGIRLTDGLGSTEMIHIFIGSNGRDARPGATGKPLPGYEAVVLDPQGTPSHRGSGRLAVKGPTGCRYLNDVRQKDYVQNGWNITGDYYWIDDDGYFWFEARGDDMIISAGYNIGGPEVENALLLHPAVGECAVIGVPDPQRGQIVKAYVVLSSGHTASQELTEDLQRFVKEQIAPYKYPRAIEYVTGLPKTATGKVQRFALRQAAKPLG